MCGIAGKAREIDFIAGHSFRGDVLTRESTVVDLGLNTGEFALDVIRRYGCRVIGVEPMPGPLARLPKTPQLSIEHAAITSREATVTIHYHPSSCPTALKGLAADQARTISVPGVSLEGVLEKYHVFDGGNLDLLKVDIEGAELSMFEATPDSVLERLDQITVEFHDFLDSSMRAEIDSIHRRLAGLGFQRINLSRTRNLDVLYLGPRHRLARIEIAWVLLRYKYLRGGARLARRLLTRKAA